METARVGINDRPNATRTAGAPDNAIPLAAAEEASEAVDDDDDEEDDDDDDEVARATSEAGSSCVAAAAPSAAAMAVGICSSVPAAWFKFTCPCN